MAGSGPASATAPGQHVGPFQLRRFLAHGGMAELYLAWRPASGRREVVVVKKILPHYTSDPQFAKMFGREVELASRLSHPNLVAVYDADQGEGRDCYLAMEYVHGLDLSRVLRELRQREQRMGIGEAVFIAMAMCAGLHHAHEETGPDGKPLGIVHRDVSPSNVLVSYDGQVKITDFGVAKALGLSSFTQAGTRKGKLSYMSPEQARAEPFDRRTDIFAIGVVLFEMTTGERMFAGDNELAIIHNMLFREAPRPSDIVPGYPPALEEILLEAVAPKQEDRYETALQLRRALQGFLRSHGGLPPSRASLSRLLESLVPAPPHPGDDPSFFDPEAELSLVGRDDVTTVDGQVPLTPAEAVGVDGPTAWGSSSSLPSPPVEPFVGGEVSAPPIAPGPFVSNPAPAVVSASVSHPMGVSGVGTGPASLSAPMAPVRRPEPRAPAATGFLIGSMVVVATIVAGGAFAWLAGGDDPAPAAAPAAPAPVPAAAPSLPPEPAVVPPDPVTAPVVTPPPSPATDTGSELVDPDPGDEAAVEDDDPAPSAPASRRTGRGGSRTKRARPPASGSVPAAKKPPPPPPPSTKSAPPPPPPTKKSKKRPPTDTLLPILDG